MFEVIGTRNSFCNNIKIKAILGNFNSFEAADLHRTEFKDMYEKVKIYKNGEEVTL